MIFSLPSAFISSTSISSNISHIATVAIITSCVIRPFQVVIVNVLVIIGLRGLPKIGKVVRIFGRLLDYLVIVPDVGIFRRLRLSHRLRRELLTEIFKIVRRSCSRNRELFVGGTRVDDWGLGGRNAVLVFVRIFGGVLVIVVVRGQCGIFLVCLRGLGVVLSIVVDVIEPVGV